MPAEHDDAGHQSTEEPKSRRIGFLRSRRGSTRDGPDVARELALLAIFVLIFFIMLLALWFASRATHNTWRFSILAFPVGAIIVSAIRAIGYKWMGWGFTDPDGLLVDPSNPGRLDQRLYGECEAMAEYALSRGLVVPCEVLAAIGKYSSSYPKPRPSRKGDPPDVSSPELPRVEVFTELGSAHANLSGLVAPATPRSLQIIREGSFNGVLTFLGRVRLVRLMIYLSFVLVGAFVGFATKASFVEKTAGGNPLTGGDLLFGATGSTKVFNALELVAAAGLGAVFYALYKANHHVNKRTYDPTYESTYWSRITLGVVGGILVALVIPLQSGLGKPFLALLGGFSARAVYKILIRFVETLEALVDGVPAKAKAASKPRRHD